MGRSQRRETTSSVNSPTDPSTKWYPESEVVKPVPPTQHQDFWPQFELRDAVVYNKKNELTKDALMVATRGPFTIRGYLVIDEAKQKRRLRHKVQGPIPIEIPDNTTYAIGLSVGDDRPCIWLAGLGGWYEIQPAPVYQKSYNEICQAIALFYSIVTTLERVAEEQDSPKYKTSKKRKKEGYPLDDDMNRILYEYAQKIGDGSTIEDAISRCQRHAPFLIHQVRQEDAVLLDTPFFRWLVSDSSSRLQVDTELDRDSSTSSKRKKSRTPTQSTGSSQEKSIPSSLESSGAHHSGLRLTRSRSRPLEAERRPTNTVRNPHTRSSPSAQSDDADAFNSLMLALEDVYQKLGSKSKGLSTSATSNQLYGGWRFPNYKDGTVGSHRIPVEEVLQYNATRLIQALDPKFKDHEIYGFLKKLVEREFAPRAIQHFPFLLIPRKKASSGAHGGDLRPIETMLEQGRADRDDNFNAHDRRGKALKGPRPQKSKLRPISASKKRAREDYDSGSEMERERLRQLDDSSADDEPMEDVEDSLADDKSTAAYPDPDHEPIKIVIRAEKGQSNVPKGPYDTWVCEEDDCEHIVRGGEVADCQARIRDHVLEHQNQTQRVNLAMKESRNHLPVNHLLEKLQRIGMQQTLPRTSGPDPIKRNLIM